MGCVSCNHGKCTLWWVEDAGWTVVLKKPSGSLSLLDCGTIYTLSCSDLNDKLFCIFSCLSVVIQNFSVSVASNVFVNLNPKASMFLCYARAASILVLKIFLS
ncbi:crossover junction endodeoxyribonuclease RuvC [Anaplasma phagocytophilum]|uniref:crossover junction endodeoxyribonuclease RuvC n=1 Tax=Anaplasma phagocytophilum TaxID=948 RepID=UPI00200FF403|nr:crossover junction endodeoxyribonuclease RuvC [Anaplasma phagocytophilum]